MLWVCLSASIWENFHETFLFSLAVGIVGERARIQFLSSFDIWFDLQFGGLYEREEASVFCKGLLAWVT